MRPDNPHNISHFGLCHRLLLVVLLLTVRMLLLLLLLWDRLRSHHNRTVPPTSPATTTTRQTRTHDRNNELKPTHHHHNDVKSNREILLLAIRLQCGVEGRVLDVDVVIVDVFLHCILEHAVERYGVPQRGDHEDDDGDGGEYGGDDAHEDVETSQSFYLVLPRRGDTDHAGERDDGAHPYSDGGVFRPVVHRVWKRGDGDDTENEDSATGEEGQYGSCVMAASVWWRLRSLIDHSDSWLLLYYGRHGYGFSDVDLSCLCSIMTTLNDA